MDENSIAANIDSQNDDLDTNHQLEVNISKTPTSTAKKEELFPKDDYDVSRDLFDSLTDTVNSDTYEKMDTDDIAQHLLNESIIDENLHNEVLENRTISVGDIPSLDHDKDTDETLIDDTVNDDEDFDDDYLNAMLDSVADEEVNDTEFQEDMDDQNGDENVKKINISKNDKLIQIPLGRIKSIMKADPDVQILSADCVFLMAKSCEMFLQWLGKEIYSYTLQQKKKTIQKRDLNLAITEHPALEFLDGALE